MKLGELFAGYGGLGMAVEEVFGAELAWVSEFDPAPSKILAHHWPNVPNHGDVTKIDWAAVEPVDIISGGSPCQDLSLAGKRRGMAEGTRSNLFESMCEAIEIIKPKFVVWENVRGALSAEAISASDMEYREGFLGERRGHLRALGRVLGNLADLGFDAEWRGIRAADVGAPHGRFRVFVLAANRDYLGEHRTRQWTEQNGRGQLADSRFPASDAYSRDDSGRFHDTQRREVKRIAIAGSGAGTRRTAISDTNNSGPQGQHHQAGTSQAERHGHASQGVDWREYTGAVRRWEALYRTAPAPVELGPTGKPRLSPRFTEWMMGLPEGWLDVPGVGWGDQLKASGNGVVPQQAIAALKDMLAAFQKQEVAA